MIYADKLFRPWKIDFKPIEFEGVKKQAGANAFTMSLKKWIKKPLVGRYGILPASDFYYEKRGLKNI